MEAEAKITLKSSDGQTFQVDQKVAFMSETVKKIVQEVQENAAVEEIPLQQVRAEVLAKVLEYCKYHVGDPEKDPEEDEDEDEWKPGVDEAFGDKDKDEEKELTEGQKWDKEFVSVDDSMVFELILAANYMNVKPLLEYLIQHVADLIIACGDDPEAIRQKFGIQNDLTDEEVAAIKRNNTWFFS